LCAQTRVCHACAASSGVEKTSTIGFPAKGGDQLSKFGSYTDEESARVCSLKTAKANTSANLKGGMPPRVQKKIAEQAIAHGLDPTMMLKMATMESGGNAQTISSTSAIGVYQFTVKTATSVGIKNRFDEDQNIKGGMELTVQNKAAREKAGLLVTPENLYMAHQLGIGAAIEVIRGAKEGKKISELSALTRKGMDLNYGKDADTAAQYIAKNKEALDKRYASSVKQEKERHLRHAKPRHEAGAWVLLFCCSDRGDSVNLLSPHCLCCGRYFSCPEWTYCQYGRRLKSPASFSCACLPAA
jgi:hypothetical protein